MKHVSILIFIVAVSLASMVAVAQPAPQTGSPFVVFGSDQGDAPVILTGGYRLLGQTSNRSGSFQEKPPDFWRVEFTPSAIIYGVPITANLLLSSEQRDVRQDINAFSISLDPDAVKRIVTQRAYRELESYAMSEVGWMLGEYENVKDSLKQYDPQQLEQLEAMRQVEQLRDVSNGNITNYEDVLTKLGVMSDVESVMASLPKIGVGTVFPTFTPLSLSGARIIGGNLEWNPGGVFYLHAVYGTTQRPLSRIDSSRTDTTIYRTSDNSDFGRILYGGRIGYGSITGNHVTLTGVYTIDDKSSLTIADTLSALTPQKNILSTIDFRVELIPGIWSLEGEVGGSLTIGDLNSPQFGTSSVPDFLLAAADSNASSYVDWSATASTAVNIRSSGTRFSGTVRRIGAGYRALGVPNLRVDVLRFDVKVDQALMKRQMSIGLFARQDRDNLIPIKRSTSTLLSIGATLGLNFRGLPYLRLSYAPYVQQSDASDTLLQYVNRTTMWNASGGYAYRISDLNASTNITFARQDAATKNNLYDYAVTSVIASQSVSLLIPLSLTAGVGWIHQEAVASPSTTIITIDGSASYILSDVLSASGGLTLALDDTYGDRTGFFLGVTARLGQFADVDLRAERTLFNERLTPPVLGGAYQESVLRLTISRSW
ncbi:MAG TPA: hypothetical protein VK147_01170 [Candidatus Didemnitutus sp.]|nr:hypothetical protein [Candidatus Didemnitutus sp.]